MSTRPTLPIKDNYIVTWTEEKAWHFIDYLIDNGLFNDYFIPVESPSIHSWPTIKNLADTYTFVQITILHGKGLTYREVSKELGISTKVIARMRERDNWTLMRQLIIYTIADGGMSVSLSELACFISKAFDVSLDEGKYFAMEFQRKYNDQINVEFRL